MSSVIWLVKNIGRSVDKRSTGHETKVTKKRPGRRRFGHKPVRRQGGMAVRGLWGRRGNTDAVSEALSVLTEWTRDGRQLRRTLALSEAQHAALTERVKVVADALRVRPVIRRINGHTQIALGSRDGDPLTESDITLAARIEDAYRAIIRDG